MNINNSQAVDVKQAENNVKTNSSKTNSNANFSEELRNIKKTEEDKNKKLQEEQEVTENTKVKKTEEKKDDENVGKAIDGLNETIDELNKLNQKDENGQDELKQGAFFDDINNNREDFGLIDNNMNIQEQQDKFNMQMNANMNFNSDAQPFTEFVNQEQAKNVLKSSAKDLEEEKSILSTMEENVAIANKNMAMAKTKTVENEHGVHKIDKKTNIIVDTVVSYDRVVMDKADVEFFANLVDNGILNISDVENVEKSSRVSKALADLLAKAMNENKPVRIDFDNNISVIIKIDRTGKISADFLPSSQVAEAYLKENLPLLKQRFDENNIDYNELNQRQRKQENQDNRKKERKDE